ncbi:MAG: chromate efflux transporter [Solirubrobacterales bacterium]|nr:chromate efflux transporter [Solirubrobacterales bacterium]MBV9811080.1 chromate efflux transporter [Solirubrobacterales bacterium]
MSEGAAGAVSLRTIALQWTRIGVTGFGGPPTHIALLRRLVVEERHWVDQSEFEDGLAACNLLPGPASTQLAIFLARRIGGPGGAVVGGLGFIVPAVAMIIALSAVFFAQAPPRWVRGAGAGASAAVAAVAVRAGLGLARPSFDRAANRGRWLGYVVLGLAAGALIGRYLVLVLLGCGVLELAVAGGLFDRSRAHSWTPMLIPAASMGAGGLGALAWVAFKVGALSYGGGFVIVPLMQGDAVHTYHWMTSAQFLSAVALGQVTPGPVVATVAAVGYAAHGVAGAALAAAVAFAPSFALVLLGGGRFELVRTSSRAQAFLAGAGPAAIGAILGAAIPLAAALRETWQFAVLAAAAAALLLARRGVVATLVGAGAAGVAAALVGAPMPR